MLKKLFIFLFVVFLVFFQGLNAKENLKNNNVENNMNKNNINLLDNDEDFFDEFNEENKIQEVYDPLYDYNVSMTNFNDSFMVNIVQPISKIYADSVPHLIRDGIVNIFNNLRFPVDLVNNLLQLKFKNSLEVTERFVMNSVFGIAGFLDVAKDNLEIYPHKEDFGQTLGYWGVGEGFSIVLPFLGPSNLRDSIALLPDYYTSPITTTGDNKVFYKIPDTLFEEFLLYGTKVLNENSLRLGVYESMKKDALQLYPFLRDAYSQRRKEQIKK